MTDDRPGEKLGDSAATGFACFGTLGVCVRAVAWGLSKPYALVMRVRRWGYRRGVLASHRAMLPVISVGNVTVGGTGKTPMVAWIVRLLTGAGHKPTIVTRGYKAVRTHDGAPPKSDEAELLASLTGAPVIIEPDRVAGAGKAVEGGADVVVLDDAFQHRRIKRDLDIVLIDAAEPFGFGHCLPRGLLREPPGALRDADVVVVTHADEVTAERLAELRGRLGELCRPDVPIAEATHKPVAVIDEAGERRSPEALADKAVLEFSGLGRPEHFGKSLESLGARVVEAVRMGDHAAYRQEDLAYLAELAERKGAEVMVTTQKDHVRLAHLDRPAGAPIWQLAIEMDITAGRDELVAAIERGAEARP